MTSPQVFTGSSGTQVQDSMELVNHPSPSSPKTHSSFFFRSDSDVDAESLDGESGEGAPKQELLEKEQTLPVRWVWPK